MKLLMIAQEDRYAAEQVLDELEAACDRSGAQLKDLVLAYRHPNGRSRYRQTSDGVSGSRLLRGGLLGLLATIVLPTGSAAATVTGGVLGGVIAAVGDDAVDNHMMRSLALAIRDNDGVVLALGESAEIGKLQEVIQPYWNRVQYQPVPEATMFLMRELTKLSMQDLENS